jgi:RNA polymerase sigma-70 factor (ECF subfamily)
VVLGLLNGKPIMAAPAIVAHDAKTFDQNLVRLLPELRGRALRLVGNATTAEDLAQDTVERALKFRAQYELGTNLRAWAYQILFSVFVTRYRRCRRERNAMRDLTSDPNAWTHPSHEPSPSAFGFTRTTRSKLDAMPSSFRSVIELVDIEERSYREAAERLGVPVGTVMSRLHRGRKLLAAELREAA